MYCALTNTKKNRSLVLRAKRGFFVVATWELSQYLIRISIAKCNIGSMIAAVAIIDYPDYSMLDKNRLMKLLKLCMQWHAAPDQCVKIRGTIGVR